RVLSQVFRGSGGGGAPFAWASAVHLGETGSASRGAWRSKDISPSIAAQCDHCVRPRRPRHPCPDARIHGFSQRNQLQPPAIRGIRHVSGTALLLLLCRS
ncbi:unnamed protein product, partial [Cyprideis torosa]